MSIEALRRYAQQSQQYTDIYGQQGELQQRQLRTELLTTFAKQADLALLAETFVAGTAGRKVKPDGVLKNKLLLELGIWESKGNKADLEAEIREKFNRGYPKWNILFEDGVRLVLYQDNERVGEALMADLDKAEQLLKAWAGYRPRYIQDFEAALLEFGREVPTLTETLKTRVREAEANPKFTAAKAEFLKICQRSINPSFSAADVEEMMVQHILTEDIFLRIFEDADFHRQNNIARQLGQVVDPFLSPQGRKALLLPIQHYYQAIKTTAARIADHSEKQKFLKVVYEQFYKSYNPKAADRLGVVYTPNEVVRFMVRATDELLFQHFGKGLKDEGVDILDPATGTGTFITEIIDFLPKTHLPHKYQNELHANEVAILPYYIANLNIEYTYQQKMQDYAEFTNLCFVDTLDNLGFERVGGQMGLMGFSQENAERITRQNKRNISVVIGNPPYNANQQNENDNNKNRTYPGVDKRIKDTYIAQSTAQKTKVYDMYVRFFRWASDRLGESGIVSFIVNSSFIEGKSFDGFRKSLVEEYQHIYVIDLGGNIRTLSGLDGIFLNEENTIFGVSAAVGIAMIFMVKSLKRKSGVAPLNYIHPTDIRAKRDEKLAWLAKHEKDFNEIHFDSISPDKKGNWINQSVNDWDALMPVADKEVKLGKKKEGAVFKLYTSTFKTNRDEWVMDFSPVCLLSKIEYFANIFNALIKREYHKDNEEYPADIKWSSGLKENFQKRLKVLVDYKYLIAILSRPYVKKEFYALKTINDRLTENHYIINGPNLSLTNQMINIPGESGLKPFQCLATDIVPDYSLLEATQCLPRYRYDKAGRRVDNITDWALSQFRERYGDGVSKDEIFHFIYGVLHNPLYRLKYALNLKREFPRIPFYADFRQWAAWGAKLMALHIGYEAQEPYGLELRELPLPHADYQPVAKLKADKATGIITLDDKTELHGVPREAWDYKLGNRSALEWVLDQYKEKKPKDPTIREKFNTYRFADYKAHVIDLLRRVCTVSVRTVEITRAMAESGEDGE